MTCDGFSVDPDLLRDASRQLAGLVEALKVHPPRDVDCPGSAFGHGDVARATANFTGRLQRSVETLTKDTDAVVSRLRGTADTYTDIELKVKSLLECAVDPVIGEGCS